jgi:hypothetical protein
MNATHQAPTKRRRSPRNLVALHTETPAPSSAEDLYFFALALTGDADFAEKLVADAGELTRTGHGIFTH